MLDLLAQILWYAVFATPILAIPLTWRSVKPKKFYEYVLVIFVGLLFAGVLSFVLFQLSVAIIFRNGMGS